jgi:putative ABC transport system ATP-binding protein
VILARASAVCKSYGEGDLRTDVLFDVSLALPAGELTLLMGPSGSGKTTLLSILAGLLRPSSGSVDLCGEAIASAPQERITRTRRAHLGFVFQTYNLFPALTALENVAEIVAMKGLPIAEARARAGAALMRVGLGERLHHVPAKLSGGEKQRVAIARAFATEPAVIFGDEPTAALDARSATTVMQLLRDHVGPGRSVLLVTHDRRMERFADRVIELGEGRVQSDTYLVQRGEKRAS